MKTSALTTFVALAPAALAAWSGVSDKDIKYTTVKGYFQQDDPDTVAETFDFTEHNFGLISNRTYPTDKHHHDGTQWERFDRWLKYLNKSCRKDNDSRYKMLFLARHGQGFHNVAETYYGTPAWNCYWAEEDGNGTSVWADPLLTPAGYGDAYKASAYYESRYEHEGMPYFESYYSSPLSRCILTANATFGNLTLPAEHPFAPTIKENLREGISIHTCDRRSTKTQIDELAPPGFTFEEGFTEEDELWRGTESETAEHQLARSKLALDDIFTDDDATWLTISSHSGEIRRLLEVLGHREFTLETGQIIPVLVKAEAVSPTPTTSYVGFTPEATCDAPPVTSIAGEGCMCSTTAPTPTAS